MLPEPAEAVPTEAETHSRKLRLRPLSEALLPKPKERFQLRVGLPMRARVGFRAEG